MPAHQQTLRLFFMIGEKTISERNWIAAPRAGDVVRLRKKIYRVTEVLWGMAEDDDVRSDPTLHVSIKETERTAI